MEISDSNQSNWLADAWYVAAMSEEIERGPLGRQICGERIVFFRTRVGDLSALEDFCPHRGAPLSLGTVDGDRLVCGYHGLAVGCTGKVASMPGQRVGGFPAVRRFPVAERYGFIWVWPGDPDLANTATLPDFPWFDDAEWCYAGGRYHIKADYRLMIDNLMDLTHETYVHHTSIGQREIDESPVKTTVEGAEVVTKRLMENIVAAPFWQMALRTCGLPDDVNVDRWQISRFSLPSHVMLEAGVAVENSGGYDADNSKKASSVVTGFITPETPGTHWYFWGFARSFCLDDDGLTEKILGEQAKILHEDLVVLESQQASLERYPGRKLLKLNIDAGGARSRMMIDRAISNETGLAEAL